MSVRHSSHLLETSNVGHSQFANTVAKNNKDEMMGEKKGIEIQILDYWLLSKVITA